MQSAAAVPTGEPSKGQTSKGKQITRDWFWWLPPRLRNSPYWLIAIVLHLILFLLFTIWVVFDVWRPGSLEGSFYDGGGQDGVDVQPPPASQEISKQLAKKYAGKVEMIRRYWTGAFTADATDVFVMECDDLMDAHEFNQELTRGLARTGDPERFGETIQIIVGVNPDA